MTGMSVLRSSLNRGLLTIVQNGRTPLQKQANFIGKASVRRMGDHAQMEISSTRYEWQRMKNDVHFYLALGIIPLGLVVMYNNLFIGQAELSDIPEGYEPEEHEYFKHPITRWLVKYVIESQQKAHERTLHYYRIEDEKQYWNRLHSKCKRLATDRLDHRGWYFVPIQDESAEQTADKRPATIGGRELI